MNEVDKKLHEEIHKEMMTIHPDNIFSPRVNVFEAVNKRINVKPNGKVVDIGCGNGYASIWIAKNYSVKKVFALEASQEAIDELLPRNIQHHNVENIVSPLNGSFDDLPFNSEIDYIVSFGALHHSTCLLTTMKSISKSLINGGYLVAQEPVMPNETTNQDYIDKYNIPENRFGLEMKNGDRYDRFFREAEYIAAAAFSGLDLVMYEEYKPARNLSRLKSSLRKLLIKVGIKHDSRKYEYQKRVMKKIMVFKKNEVEYIPHTWKCI